MKEQLKNKKKSQILINFHEVTLKCHGHRYSFLLLKISFIETNFVLCLNEIEISLLLYN